MSLGKTQAKKTKAKPAQAKGKAVAKRKPKKNFNIYRGAYSFAKLKEMAASPAIISLSSMTLTESADLLAKLFNVRWDFLSDDRAKTLGRVDILGEGYFRESRISINRSLLRNKALFLSFFLHEIGHVVAYRERRYPAYHFIKMPKSLAEKKALLSTCLRAEKYVDRWAERLMREFFPELRFKPSYTSEKDRLWLSEFTKQRLAVMNGR